MKETSKLNIETPFENGIHSVLKIEWRLNIETPLCIKNGHSFAWQSVGDNTKKSRNRNTIYKWNTPKQTNDDNEISDLYYGLFVEDGKLIPKYMVPASSLRGSLRSWTIRHLVDRYLWDDRWQRLNPEKKSDKLPNLLKPEPDTEKIKISDIRKTLDNQKTGFALVAGIFGMTLENLEDGENFATSGRLRLETSPMNPSKYSARPQIDSQFGFMDGGSNNFGPDNAVRHITWRGPVDRVTHGAKDGGLHTFLEFSTGQSFHALIRVLNPTTEDLALIVLWQREINRGYMRFGGLTSIGRGKMKVADSTANLYWINNISEEIKPFLIRETDLTDGSTPENAIWNKSLVNLTDNTDLLIKHLATILGKGK